MVREKVLRSRRGRGWLGNEWEDQEGEGMVREKVGRSRGGGDG